MSKTARQGSLGPTREPLGKRLSGISHWLFHRLFGTGLWGLVEARFMPIVREALGATDGPVVDAACGRFNPYLDVLGLKDTIGIDADQTIKNTNQLHRNILIQDLHDEIPLKNVGGIISVYTWEHLHSPEIVLKNFAKILSDGAKLIIIAPQKFYYISLLTLMLPPSVQNLAWKVLKGHHRMPFPAYFRLCSKKTLGVEANAYGLDIVTFETFDMPPVWFARVPPLFLVFCGWMVIANQFKFLSPLRSTFIAVLRKRSHALNDADTPEHSALDYPRIEGEF
jgi:SAM-dependent methyltransferase